MVQEVEDIAHRDQRGNRKQPRRSGLTQKGLEASSMEMQAAAARPFCASRTEREQNSF